LTIRKCFSVIGYHNSGKTTLISKMIPLLKGKGYSVSVIKHAKHMSLKDSDVLFSVGSDEVIALAEDFSLIYMRLEDLRSLMALVKSDILILEGFKREPFPNLVRARDEKEARELLNGLSIACVLDEVRRKDVDGVPVFSPSDVSAIVDIALERSFPPLMLLNCGKCGEGDCRLMAEAILRGRRKPSECVALPSRVTLKVNDVLIPLKPFVEDVFIALNTSLIKLLKEKPDRIVKVELKVELSFPED